MNPRSSLLAGLVGSGVLLSAASLAWAQAPAAGTPPAAAPAGGGGFGRGGAPGTPGLALPPIDLYNAVSRTPILNDTELTAITRVDEGLEKQIATVAAARAALNQATFNLPTNAQDLAAKVRDLANAEVAAALGRADGFARLKTDLKATTPQKVAAIAMALQMPSSNGTAGGGGRGGGGGGAAPAAAAPGAPGTAPAVPAAGAARGGG